MPRVEIPLIGPSYTNREKPLSMQSAVNMWPEINPEARSQVALHNAAGIRVFAELEGIDRGMHDFNNLLYAVNGTTLYSIDATGAHIALGTVPGKSRVQMASDSNQLIIVTGSTPYRYTVSGGLEAITDPDLVNPTCVAYINSQFVFDNNNGVWGEFVTSSIEAGLAIDALDFATAESHPDDITAIVTYRQLVYFFGSHSVEPWSNTGTGNPPFARASSGVRPFGVAGRDAVLTTTEYIYFLDHQRIPRRSNGLDFPSIGTPALGVEFSKYSRIDDCIAMQFVQDGQQFVAFTFPTADRTWCYHEPSGLWFELSYIKTGAMPDISRSLPSPSETIPPAPSLPPPPSADPQTEIVAPYWTFDGILTGNWIDLTDFTSESFESMFGYPIEGADFNAVYSVAGDGQVSMRGLVNTSDSGNRLQIQNTNDCSYASLYVCDASGNVVDSMTYKNVPNGDSVLVPTGANYYIIVASDTGSCKVKKWDSSVVSVAGAVSWDSFFGLPLSTSRVLYDVTKVIPSAGISIWFTVPDTASPYVLELSTIELTGFATTRTGSVNQTVGDYTSSPSYVWGIGGGITCGINYTTGVDISLTPGQTYIFNVRNDSPVSSGNFIRIQNVLVAQ